MSGTATVTYNGWATFFGEVSLLAHHGPSEVTRGFVSTAKGAGPIAVIDGHAVIRGKWVGVDVRAEDLAHGLRRALAGDSCGGIPGHYVSGEDREPAVISIRLRKDGVEVNQTSTHYDHASVVRFDPIEVPALVDFLDRYPVTSC